MTERPSGLLTTHARRLRATAATDWVAIVDDHASMRSSLARALRLDGFRVESFASAREYLERDGATSPLCVVLDMHLPDMSGHELAHFLARERPPLPPIIFISGHENLLASVDGCCNAHGRLRKPFEIDALLALVRSLRVVP
jgi:FixJ family two-component response regulator